MNYYLSWGLIPYALWVLALVLLAWFLLKQLGKMPDKYKSTRTWTRVGVILAVVFLMQVPFKHDSTHYQKYRLHFDKGVEYNGQQIERQEERESWQERAAKLKVEAKRNADERTQEALK